MIIAWVVYSVFIAALLFAAGVGAEFVCRALGWPTRVVWGAALALSAILAASALWRIAGDSAASVPLSVTVLAAPYGEPPKASADVPSSRQTPASTARSVLDLPARAVRSMRRDDPHANDTPAMIAVGAMTLAGCVYLLFAALRMRRLVRGLASREVNGHRVFVSESLGPALVGIARPRIVVPRWVLSLDNAERQLILAHEREHAEARDPALLAGAAVLLAIAPWNAAFWAMFARLRLAIESDCDRRVLASHRDPRCYGDLLVTIYERASFAGGQLAFVARRSNLERRIRWLMSGAPRLRSRRGIAAIVGSAALVAAACETSAPTETARDVLAPSLSVVGVLPRCAQPSNGDLFPDLRAWARERRPEVALDIKGRDAIVGFVLDEHCVIQRDTLVYDPHWQHGRRRPSDIFSIVFADTTGLLRNRGNAFAYSPDRKSVLMIAYVVKPSAAWRARMARTPCGIDIRFDERCFARGPLVLRMLDSVHALVAIRGFGKLNAPVEHTFLITLARPNAALSSQSMAHATMSFQSGALFIDNFLARAPRLWFGTPSTRALDDVKRLPEVRVIDQLVAIAYHTGLPLTLEQIARLRPASRCAGLPGSCYEVEGRSIEFP